VEKETSIVMPVKLSKPKIIIRERSTCVNKETIIVSVLTRGIAHVPSNHVTNQKQIIIREIPEHKRRPLLIHIYCTSLDFSLMTQ